MEDSLERDSDAEFHHATPASGTVDPPESSASKAHVWRSKDGCVREAEHFRSELSSPVLPPVEVLRQQEVPLEPPRPTDSGKIARRIPQRERVRNLESIVV